VEVDHERVVKEIERKVQELATRGIRSLAVAKTNEEGKWVMLGLLTFLDPPRPDTKRTIERAIEYGVDVKMVRRASLQSLLWAAWAARAA
jgi:H+-transporting ATPase